MLIKNLLSQFYPTVANKAVANLYSDLVHPCGEK